MITQNHYSVDGTAVQLAAAENGYRHVLVSVAGNKSIYIGDKDVTTTNGLVIKNTHPVTHVGLVSGDELWAISDSGTETVTVLIYD